MQRFVERFSLMPCLGKCTRPLRLRPSASNTRLLPDHYPYFGGPSDTRERYASDMATLQYSLQASIPWTFFNIEASMPPADLSPMAKWPRVVDSTITIWA